MAKRFPTFGWILLVVGVVWLLTEIGKVTIDIPWLPLILIIVALGWIINKSSW